MGAVHREPLQRVDRRFDTDLQPLAEAGDGIGRQTEDRRLIAVEVGEAHPAARASQRQRARGREHGNS